MDNQRGGSRGLARSILSNWGTFVFSAVVNFVISPMIVRRLGVEEYGAWTLLVMMVGYLGVLDLGVRAAVTRYIARFHAASEHTRSSRLYSSALMFFTAAGVVAVLLSGVMALVVGSLFHVPQEYVRAARVVAILGGLNIAVSLVSGVFGGVLIGLQRFDYANAIEIVVAALRAVAVVIALRNGYGLIGLAVVQLGVSALRGGASVFYCHRLYPQLDLASWKWDAEYLRLIFSFGLSASFLHITYGIMFYSDSLILNAFLPEAAVLAGIAFFSVGSTLADYARQIVSGISQTLTPRISAAEASGDRSVLQATVLTSARLSALAVLPIAITLMIRGSSFLGLWMGPDFIGLSGRVLFVLCIPLLVVAGYQVASAAMFGISKHGGFIPIFVAEAICNIGLSIIWVRAYGVIGTAMGTMVPRMVVSVIAGPWQVRRTLGIPIRTFWQAAFVQPALAMIPFAVASYAIEAIWPARNMFMYFAQVTAALPLAALGAWFICFSPAERATWGRFLQGPLRRVFGRAVPAAPAAEESSNSALRAGSRSI